MPRIPHISEPLFDAGTQKVNDNWFRFLDQIATDLVAAQAAIEEIGYETGEWEPELTFSTPGDLVVAYSFREAQYHKIGSLLVASFQVIASTFTHSTASGDLLVAGFPFVNAGINVSGATRWAGITKASYTDVAAFLNNAMDAAQFQAYGSGVAASIVTATDVPSGGTPGFRATLCYQT